MKRILSFFVAIVLHSALFAQQNATSAEIYLQLKKLNVLGSVLYVAAHPDDENTRLLTWLSKDRLYRTAYLSLTRGDGGQNLIGDEQGIALGLIRTQELLAARRIDGTERAFSRAYDFGFSKNPEETFTKWDREKVLSDVVWAIRKYQPDVIITRFPTTGEGGHGHHTASAILANEAFKAAADPKRFPEQLKWVSPWQAKRILWNTFNFGGNNTQRPDQFTVDVGGYNAVLGKSYGEIAADSRSQHKSQGFGVPRSRGEAYEFFATTGGTVPTKDLMDDVSLTWRRVKGGEAVEAAVNNIIANFDFVHPEASLPALANLRTQLMNLSSSYWVNKKLEEVQALIAQCSGLFIEATTSVQKAVQGDSLRIQFTAINRSAAPVQVRRIQTAGLDSAINLTLSSNQLFSFTKTIFVAQDKTITQPYWLQQPMDKGMFVVNDQMLIGQPDVSPAFVSRFHIMIAGAQCLFERTVQYKTTDPVKGEIYQPLFVTPPVTVVTAPDLLLFHRGQQEEKKVDIKAFAHRKVATTGALIRSDGETVLDKKDSLAQLENNQSVDHAFFINNKTLDVQASLQPAALYKNSPQEIPANLTIAAIDYDHIPAIRYFFKDEIKTLNIDLKTAGKKVGYIPGAGDRVPEALQAMGYDVTLLDEKTLLRNNLQQYDAIITGVRAYNTAEWLNAQYEKLMDYVQRGGNLIVQYNTSSNIGPVRARISPYPFGISRNRVTNEEAEVRFLLPQHPVLNYPNKITGDDFKGWVQERSIYHASALDGTFQKILGMADPGESSDDASLVVAPYGKGFFTYTGVVFFRQLPAGVPGAYRLLANLIALDQQKNF